MDKMTKQLALLLLMFLSLPAWVNAQTTNSEQGNTLEVNVAFVELHSGPGWAYPVTNVIEKGEMLSIERKRGSWIKVIDRRTNQGWVHIDAFKQLTTATQKISDLAISQDDYLARDWEVGVLFGQMQEATYYSLNLSYQFDASVAAELTAGKVLGQSSNSDIYSLQLTMHLFPDWTVTPYVSAGGGYMHIQPHSVLAQAETRSHTLMLAAFGLKYHLARNFVIRAEAQQALALTDRDLNEDLTIWKLGISAFF